MTPGQPFYLDHLKTLIHWADDKEAEHCTTLKQGVPLDVESPVLRSPGIWPTKEELRGDTAPDPVLDTPVGRENYPSAELHSDDIRGNLLGGEGTGPFTATLPGTYGGH